MIPSINNPALLPHAADTAAVAEQTRQLPAAAAQVSAPDETRMGTSQHSGQGQGSGQQAQGLSSLDKALESVNQGLQAWSTGLRFDMDEDAQRLVVSIVDSTSGEVLRTIPSDAVLKIAKMIVQLQGSGIDTSA